MLHDMKDSGSLIPASLLAIRTDLEKFVELYKGFGIECIVEPVEKGSNITLVHEGGWDNPKAVVSFDKDGKFIEQSFLE